MSDKCKNRSLNKFSVKRKDFSGERVWRISPFVYTTYARWTVIITTTTTTTAIIYDLYRTYFIPINNIILYCTENEMIVKHTHILYALTFFPRPWRPCSRADTIDNRNSLRRRVGRR